MALLFSADKPPGSYRTARDASGRAVVKTKATQMIATPTETRFLFMYAPQLLEYLPTFSLRTPPSPRPVSPTIY